MTFTLAAIGAPGTPHVHVVTGERLRTYADATDDAIGGPVFAIVPVWPTIAPASRSVASDDARRRVVHYEHDIVLHRPIEPGMTLVSVATPIALLGRANGASLVIRTETRTAAGDAVNEQYVTEFFRGLSTETSVGERAPDHRLETNGGEALGEIDHRVADDQTVRYAAASGDDFAIHLDDDFARSVGLPGRIVHGLCALAFAGRAVLEAAGIESPEGVARLAVRFSAPLFPGETLRTKVWRVDDGFGFEALNTEGSTVLKDGRMELH
jgi:acyl dehydratase